MQLNFAHFNYNVTDLEETVKFYEEALGLYEDRRISLDAGKTVIVYIKNDKNDFEIELTWESDWNKKNYDLGDNKVHMAFGTDDMETAHKKHEEMKCISFENKEHGIYFICDPDGYLIEIMPEK